MAKIADIVKLKTGYADFVELKSAFVWKAGYPLVFQFMN